MSLLLIALPVALLIAAGGVWAFIWAVRTGQMDDLDTPPHRVLFDDDEPAEPDRGASRKPPRDGML